MDEAYDWKRVTRTKNDVNACVSSQVQKQTKTLGAKQPRLKIADVFICRILDMGMIERMIHLPENNT